MWGNSNTNILIAQGNGLTGVFVYNGFGAPGNPPIAWETASTVDPFGNQLGGHGGVPGVPTIGTETTGVNPAWAGLSAGNLAMSAGGTFTSAGIQIAAVVEPGATAQGLNTNGALYTTRDGGVAYQFWAQVGSGGSVPNFAANWGNFDHGGANLSIRVVPSPGRTVQLNGIVTPAAGAGITLFTLPAALRPVTAQFIWGWDVTSGAAGAWAINTSGAVDAHGFGGITPGDEYVINGEYSLDITGS